MLPTRVDFLLFAMVARADLLCPHWIVNSRRIEGSCLFYGTFRLLHPALVEQMLSDHLVSRITLYLVKWKTKIEK